MLANKIKSLEPQLPLGVHPEAQPEAVLAFAGTCWQGDLQRRLAPWPHAGLPSCLAAQHRQAIDKHHLGPGFTARGAQLHLNAGLISAAGQDQLQRLRGWPGLSG